MFRHKDIVRFGEVNERPPDLKAFSDKLISVKIPKNTPAHVTAAQNSKTIQGNSSFQDRRRRISNSGGDQKGGGSNKSLPSGTINPNVVGKDSVVLERARREAILAYKRVQDKRRMALESFT